MKFIKVIIILVELTLALSDSPEEKNEATTACTNSKSRSKEKSSSVEKPKSVEDFRLEKPKSVEDFRLQKPKSVEDFQYTDVSAERDTRQMERKWNEDENHFYDPVGGYEGNGELNVFHREENTEPRSTNDEGRAEMLYRKWGIQLKAIDDKKEKTTKKPKSTKKPSKESPKKDMYFYIPVRERWKIRTKKKLYRKKGGGKGEEDQQTKNPCEEEQEQEQQAEEPCEGENNQENEERSKGPCDK